MLSCLNDNAANVCHLVWTALHQLYVLLVLKDYFYLLENVKDARQVRLMMELIVLNVKHNVQHVLIIHIVQVVNLIIICIITNVLT